MGLLVTCTPAGFPTFFVRLGYRLFASLDLPLVFLRNCSLGRGHSRSRWISVELRLATLTPRGYAVNRRQSSEDVAAGVSDFSSSRAVFVLSLSRLLLSVPWVESSFRRLSASFPSTQSKDAYLQIPATAHRRLVLTGSFLSIAPANRMCCAVPWHLPIWTWLFDSEYSPLRNYKPEEIQGYTNAVTKEVGL